MRPSRRCPKCHGPIRIKNAPLYNGHEYCSSDCALDAYLEDKRDELQAEEK